MGWLKKSYTEKSTVLTKAVMDNIETGIEEVHGLTPTGGDDSVQIQAAINALSGRGTVILGPGTFLLNTAVLKLPRSATGLRIIGSGVGNTIIKLTATARRAFDFEKIANGDTFQNIELSDFTVDAASIESYDHVVLGTYTGGVKLSELSQMTNISVDRLTLRRIRTINVADLAASIGTSEKGCHRLNVYISPLSTDGVTNITLTNILCEDLDFMDGGNYGIAVACSGNAEGKPEGVKATWDNIAIIRCRYRRKNVPTKHFTCDGFHVGAFASGGRCLIQDCYAQNSADGGLEIDNVGRAEITNLHTKDCLYGIFLYNEVEPVSGKADGDITIKGLKTEVVELPSSGLSEGGAEAGVGLLMPSGSLPIQRVSVSDWMHTNQTITGNYFAVDFQSFKIADLIFEKVLVQATKINTATKSGFVTYPFRVKVASGFACNLTLRDIAFNYEGTVATGVFAALHMLEIEGTGGEYSSLLIDGVTFNVALSSFGSGAEELMGIMVGAGTTTIRSGVIRNVSFVSFTKAAKAWAILVPSTCTITDKLVFENCNFTGTETEAEAIVLNAGPKPHVITRNNTYKVAKAPSSLTGLTSGVGKELNTNYPVELLFSGGTGTKVTKVETSVNGGTTYSAVWEQAEGVLANFFTVGPLQTDALVRCTFTGGTQPTITLIPAAP